MAKVTYTASELTPLKAVHAGVNYVRSKLVLPSLSVSDIVFLGKIPAQATVLWWQIRGGVAVDGGTGTMPLGIYHPSATAIDTVSGLSLTNSCLSPGISLTTSNVQQSGVLPLLGTGAAMPIVCPFRPSISDEVVQRYVWVAGKAKSASWTASVSIHFSMMYVVGEGTGE